MDVAAFSLAALCPHFRLEVRRGTGRGALHIFMLLPVCTAHIRQSDLPAQGSPSQCPGKVPGCGPIVNHWVKAASSENKVIAKSCGARFTLD